MMTKIPQDTCESCQVHMMTWPISSIEVVVCCAVRLSKLTLSS